jgi:hypothetical protein
LDPVFTVPANDRGWDFIADRITEYRRMSGTLANTASYSRDDVAPSRFVIKESNVLFPWQANHQSQALRGGQVK